MKGRGTIRQDPDAFQRLGKSPLSYQESGEEIVNPLFSNYINASYGSDNSIVNGYFDREIFSDQTNSEQTNGSLFLTYQFSAQSNNYYDMTSAYLNMQVELDNIPVSNDNAFIAGVIGASSLRKCTLEQSKQTVERINDAGVAVLMKHWLDAQRGKGQSYYKAHTGDATSDDTTATTLTDRLDITNAAYDKNLVFQKDIADDSTLGTRVYNIRLPLQALFNYCKLNRGMSSEFRLTLEFKNPNDPSSRLVQVGVAGVGDVVVNVTKCSLRVREVQPSHEIQQLIAEMVPDQRVTSFSADSLERYEFQTFAARKRILDSATRINRVTIYAIKTSQLQDAEALSDASELIPTDARLNFGGYQLPATENYSITRNEYARTYHQYLSASGAKDIDSTAVPVLSFADFKNRVTPLVFEFDLPASALSFTSQTALDMDITYADRAGGAAEPITVFCLVNSDRFMTEQRGENSRFHISSVIGNI